jgi:hypothetical protein
MFGVELSNGRSGSEGPTKAKKSKKGFIPEPTVQAFYLNKEGRIDQKLP